MGRNRRRNKYSGSRSSSSNGSASSTFSQEGPSQEYNSFNRKDKKNLFRYLRDYYNGAFRVFNGKSNQNKSLLSKSDTPIIIGGHAFPKLTNEVLRQPYLALPKGLSSKQRRTVHEICCDAEIFHCGVGPSRDDRIILVSIYRDGLSLVPHIDSNQPNLQFWNYKPWACRKHAKDCNEVTEQARELIYKLIDQPRNCLRCGVDKINFSEIESEDLSQSTPPGSGVNEWVLVDSKEKMHQCIQEIADAKPTEIAFDLECHNPNKYSQMTCLVQLALNNGKEYVIDSLAPGVWESVGGLAPLFANPDIVKVGHAIGGLDVRCLHRDFGIFVVNAFDTYEAAKCLRLPSKGLAKVCGYFGLPDCATYQSLKENYQKTDWTRRPLTKPMIQYGRYDVHYLIQLRRLMMRDLVKQELWDKSSQPMKDAEARQVASSLSVILRKFDEEDETSFDDAGLATPTNESEDDDGFATPTNEMQGGEAGVRQSFFDATELRMNLELMQAISRSQSRCLALWDNNAEPHLKNYEFQSLVVRSKNGEIQWSKSQLDLYGRLAEWREGVAAREEYSGGFVCPLGLLANVALRRPTSETGLKKLQFHLPELFSATTNYMDEIFQLVRQSRRADGLEEDDSSIVPSYFDYLERERTGNFGSRSLLSELIEKIGGPVTVWVVTCVAAIAITALATRKRRN